MTNGEHKLSDDGRVLFVAYDGEWVPIFRAFRARMEGESMEQWVKTAHVWRNAEANRT